MMSCGTSYICPHALQGAQRLSDEVEQSRQCTHRVRPRLPRGSIGPGAMDDEAARKAERVKALLAGYYGAGDAQPAGAAAAGAPAAGAGGAAAAGGQAPGAPRRPVAAAAPAIATLDSATFDANQHMAQMLKTSGLERLMVEHRNTAREIKNLDTDMQQLVTENYNKFITATDTVRVMKAEIDQAIPELAKLTTIMSACVRGARVCGSRSRATARASGQRAWPGSAS